MRPLLPALGLATGHVPGCAIAPGFAAWLALPPAGRGPGLVLWQEIFGVNEHIRAVAEQYALDGFVVLAPDVFWREAPRVELGYVGDDRTRGMALAQSLQLPQLLAAIRGAALVGRRIEQLEPAVVRRARPFLGEGEDGPIEHLRYRDVVVAAADHDRRAASVAEAQATLKLGKPKLTRDKKYVSGFELATIVPQPDQRGVGGTSSADALYVEGCADAVTFHSRKPSW